MYVSCHTPRRVCKLYEEILRILTFQQGLFYRGYGLEDQYLSKWRQGRSVLTMLVPERWTQGSLTLPSDSYTFTRTPVKARVNSISIIVKLYGVISRVF
jgi:hypothetical protein